MPVLALGLSPFIMQSTESLLSICFNTSLQKYGGDLAVGSMTILTSIMQILSLPLSGLTQGAQPIISYNFGAGNKERVKQAFRLLFISCVAFATLYWLLNMAAPGTPRRCLRQRPGVKRHGFLGFTNLSGHRLHDGYPDGLSADLRRHWPGKNFPLFGPASKNHSADPPHLHFAELLRR